jgi:hypothetical protein
MRVHEVAGNVPGTHSLPRHRMPLNSRDEGSKGVLMTRRAISGGPWVRKKSNALLGADGRILDKETRNKVIKVGRCRLTLSNPR